MLTRLIPSILLIVALAGCGSSSTSNNVPVRGTLTDKSGQPLAVAGREIGTGMVTLTFIPVKPVAGGDQTFAATADVSGKFDLPGGVPTGEYRVAVRQWEPYPTTDKLGGRYDETNSKLVVNVNGKDELKIEVE